MQANTNVIKSWVRGRSADNGRSTLHTDGDNLYSYQLQIGYTDKRGVKVVKLYTGANGNFKSKTTSGHVNLASLSADRTEQVD